MNLSINLWKKNLRGRQNKYLIGYKKEDTGHLGNILAMRKQDVSDDADDDDNDDALLLTHQQQACR